MKTFKKAVSVLATTGLVVTLAACSNTQHTKKHGHGISNAGAPTHSTGLGGSDHLKVGAGLTGTNESGSFANKPVKAVFYFDFNQDVLTSKAKADIKAQAANLRGRDVTVRLEGHADEMGSREYNMALSERRANSVASYLRALGVSGSKMSIVAFGEEKPAADGSSSRAHSLNRRVELK
ncbi:MAG: OmpA family protein [Pseudomonadota bacterium]